ncbi:hypothetical protein TVAG_302450 [Trichomonas vaginalis G3]|uniref:C2H2-type domain-containing protein n=1 Tax=Trichomonas vaginalis (strain ATCC PRA-98 / G3) TaxID=412133 RepID=A2EGS0_TRIV3|nr:protein polyubiquitination [Trichomonas vaginalis G3]EAY08158.1 hypothetical protein TVAG_302450 [Trichomonas vaginalis G3]KAI5548710.1 protein polyubiquitination [Trichomonas vaginalis G3]|eukprot:XP_001320381.1 hypothetical protein [Trichomonas vaginalis G3]
MMMNSIDSLIRTISRSLTCPGCVHSDYFTMILDMVSPNMKLKVYQNKIVIEDPKMQQMIEKTVKDIASLMPFVGETMFAIEIMNNISLEVYSIDDKLITRLVDTNSLFFYKFDKHCFDFCLKNINLLNDPDKSLRISYIDKNIPLVLVSNKAIQIPSEVIRFNQNPKTEYVCDLRELSQHENIAVDEVIFNPPAYKFHPSLFNSQGAVEFLLEYLRAHDIVCFRDNNKIGMSWQDAQKARNILEEDVEFHPPFKTLNIKKDVSLSLVISKTSEISPYWVVDSQRKLLIVPENESETAKSILSDFVYENEIEDFDDVKVFGCTDICDNPEESKNYIVAYDVKNNTSQAKHFCLTCLEKFLDDTFNENKGNKYNKMPRAINFEGYSPIGQMFFSLSDDKVFDLMQRWLKSVIIATLHTSPEKIFSCPEHGETVYDFNKISECPICHKRFCKKCMTHHNQGEVCRKNLEENLPENDCKKKCPRCGVMIFREIGSDLMTCLCGAHFCWRCKACFNSLNECYAHIKAVHYGYY